MRPCPVFRSSHGAVTRVAATNYSRNPHDTPVNAARRISSAMRSRNTHLFCVGKHKSSCFILSHFALAQRERRSVRCRFTLTVFPHRDVLYFAIRIVLSVRIEFYLKLNCQQNRNWFVSKWLNGLTQYGRGTRARCPISLAANNMDPFRVI